MSQQYPQQTPPPGQDGFAQGAPQGQSYENYETQAPPGVPPGPAPGPPAAGGRKKRAYAGQAYEFGAGANAGLGGQQQAGGAAYSGYSAQADAAGYPQGGYTQNPAAAQQGQTPMYGHQEVGGMGGYQPPQPAYSTQPQGGVAGVTQQFGQMNVNQQAAPQPQQQQTKAPVLNQLYPTDLSNSPFNVAELDYPPPPAILPPNVSRLVIQVNAC
jgi:protein transport protein SEC24